VALTTVLTTATATLVGMATVTAGAGVAAVPPGHVAIGASSYPFAGFDRPRTTDALVAYTKGTAPTNEYGVEMSVVDGRVTKVQSNVGGMAVPASGLVLSGHGAARTWLTSHASVGTRIDQVPGWTWPSSGTPSPTAPTPTGVASGPTFRSAVTALPGLRHYYPLNGVHGARDVVGNVNGNNFGATFGPRGATFSGNQYIQLPDHNDFSVTTTGKLTIVAFLTVNDWRANLQGGEYVHWMGKGVSGAHEYTFRFYPDNSSDRPRRVSFYHFNPSGGLGAGSYFQDNVASGTEMMVVGQVNLSQTRIFRDGVSRDVDALSGYNITPRNTTTPVRLGTRDRTTGFLDGRLRRVAFFNSTLSAAQLTSLWTARGRTEG
jgi:hypothetical protein